MKNNRITVIAKAHPLAVYSAFRSGYKHKLTFFMRTIENIENLMLCLDKVIKQKLIPVLFNDFQISEELKSLIVLPCKLGGMGIISPIEIANKEYVNYRINQEINKPYSTTRTQLQYQKMK